MQRHTKKFHKNAKLETVIYKQKILSSKKYAQTKHYETKQPLQISLSSSTAGHGAWPFVWFVYPVRLHFASSYQLKIAGWGWEITFSLPSQCWDPSAWALCGPCAWCHYLWVLLYLEDSFLAVLHLHWLSQSFYLLFHVVCWALKGGVWWRHPFINSTSGHIPILKLPCEVVFFSYWGGNWILLSFLTNVIILSSSLMRRPQDNEESNQRCHSAQACILSLCPPHSSVGDVVTQPLHIWLQF